MGACETDSDREPISKHITVVGFLAAPDVVASWLLPLPVPNHGPDLSLVIAISLMAETGVG
jgi:hypothetical protein